MVRTEIVNMTPEMADDLLEINTSNRKPRANKINTYIDMINRGEWVLTHQGVAISQSNVLLDGQHRLMAISKSGQSLPIMVTTGLPDSTFSAIDSGTPRNMADLTRIERKVVDVIKFFLVQVDKTSSLSPSIVKQLHQSRLGESIITACSVANRRVLASAPTRAAAAIMYYKYGDVNFEAYRNIVNANYELLNPVQHALLKKMAINGDIVERNAVSAENTGQTARKLRYVAMHYALNPLNSENKKIIINEAYKTKCLQELRSVVKDNIGATQ
jgi:hypothetical protein